MKFIYLSIFLFLYSFSVLAQVKNVEITYSKEAEMSNFEAFKEIIKSDDGYYSLKISQKGFIYNPDRSLVGLSLRLRPISMANLRFARVSILYLLYRIT